MDIDTFDEDIEACDPFLMVNVVCGVFVKIFKDPIHNHVIRNVEVFMEKLSKLLPIQLCIETLGFLYKINHQPTFR